MAVCVHQCYVWRHGQGLEAAMAHRLYITTDYNDDCMSFPLFGRTRAPWTPSIRNNNGGLGLDTRRCGRWSWHRGRRCIVASHGHIHYPCTCTRAIFLFPRFRPSVYPYSIRPGPWQDAMVVLRVGRWPGVRPVIPRIYIIHGTSATS